MSQEITVKETGLLWIDTETSGVNNAENQILQLAAVITGPEPLFTIRSYWMTYIKPIPGMEINKEALEVNKLDLDFLNEEGATESEVALTLQSFVYQYPFQLRFAGFYASFDLGFIEAVERRTALQIPFLRPPEYLIYDVHKLAKKKVPGSALPIDPKWGNPSYKLVNVQKYFGFSNSGAHDAGWDIYNTIRCARLLCAMEQQAA